MTTDTTARPGAVTWLGLTVVATAAAVLSFATVRDLAASAGYPDRLAWLLPVVIDATAVVGSRIWLGGAGAPGAVHYARALALAAAVVTVGANVLQHGLAAYHQDPPWWLVAALAAIPPTALVAVAHQVALLTRPAPDDDPVGDELAPQPGPAELAARAREVVTTADRPVGRRRLARELDITEHQARQLLAEVSTPGAAQLAGLPETAPAPAVSHRANGALHHV